MNISKSVARVVSVVAAVVCLSPCLAGNAVNPDAVNLVPMPMPVEFSSDMDRPVTFDQTTVVTLDCPDGAGMEWLSRHFTQWFGEHSPCVAAGKTGLSIMTNNEAYAISVDASGVRMAARSLAGVRWAAYTLRPLAFAKRGTFRTEGRMLPTMRISDAPHLAFRGIHLCWIPEVRATLIERAIRLAAQMKFNYCILESWGMYESAKNPWFGWPKGALTKKEIARLVAIGKDLGITLIPQIPSFGHASLSRSCSLKHAILDIRPEYEPLFEPGGWNWCISNPETQRVLREIIAEMHDDFGKPPFIHLGCDEAQPPTCPECRKRPYGELVCQHITGLAEFVKQRGARAMIWHDMLLKQGDSRWDGFVAFGSAQTAKLADLLPKDVIVCDWEYGRAGKGEAWPTIQYFIEKEFPVVGCPWLNFNEMRPMANTLAKGGAFGYLQTTWHHMRRDEMRRMFVSGSSAAWGGGNVPHNGFHGTAPLYDSSLAIVMRLVGHDMKVSDPRDTGDCEYQIPPSWWYDN